MRGEGLGEGQRILFSKPQVLETVLAHCGLTQPRIFLRTLTLTDACLPFPLSCPQMIETDEDFSPFPGGYDYLVDFLDLSFPKERPSREHPYEEVSATCLWPWTWPSVPPAPSFRLRDLFPT